MDERTANFLRIVNEQNTSIAAREAQLEAEKVQPDLIRLQREKERREKWGALRAREQPSKRPHRVRRLFGFTDLS